MGYRPDPNDPKRFVHPDGHPFHPITFPDEINITPGDCIRAVALFAYDAGTRSIADVVREGGGAVANGEHPVSMAAGDGGEPLLRKIIEVAARPALVPNCELTAGHASGRECPICGSGVCAMQAMPKRRTT